MTSPAHAHHSQPGPWQRSRAARLAGPALFGVLFFAAAAMLSTVGLAPGVPAEAGLVAALGTSIAAAITPVLYVLAALGWGRLLAARFASGSPSRHWMQLALGLSLLLSLSHLLGVLGLLSAHGPLAATPISPTAVGWFTLGIGLALLADQVVRGSLRPERWPVVPIGAAAWAPALGLLVVAACNPPGSLWASEFGGYDALSYHLQLAKEWQAGPIGRVWPVEYNVYSFLPSYVESAFVHLGAISIGGGSGVERLLGDQSHWVYSCQFLHASFALISAMLCARLATVIALRAGASAPISRLAGLGAGGVFLATPWTIVVGSLAYNDLAVTAMLAGAMLVAFDETIKPPSKAIAVGWLIGVACSAKPTAIFLGAPAAGVALLANMPRARWIVATALGSVAGVLAMLPWLIRNVLASGGNPVFPFLAGPLGHAHWSDEQIARYIRAHFFDGSIGDRILMIFGERGLAHTQWAIVPAVALVSFGLAALWRASRRLALTVGLAALLPSLAWMALTHLQSRFLLPTLVPMSALFGLGATAVLAWSARRSSSIIDALDPGARPLPRGAAVTLLLIPLSLAGWSVLNFLPQLGQHPNRLLVFGTSGLTGLLHEPMIEQMTAPERARFMAEALAPPGYINLSQRLHQHGFTPAPTPAAPGELAEGVYLLGDAIALHYLGALGELRTGEPTTPATVHYNTAWDRSLLGEAIRAHPDDPAAWSDWFLARGIGFVLINYRELGRLVEKDHYYDSDVTLARLQSWTSDSNAGLHSVQRWEVEPGEPAAAGGGRARHVEAEFFRIRERRVPTKPVHSGSTP